MGKMCKFTVEFDVEDVVKGAVIGAGIGVCIGGICSIIKSVKMKALRDEEIKLGSDDFAEEIEKLEKRRRKSLFSGIRRIVCGTFISAVGVFSFTNTGKKMIDDGKSYVSSIDKQDILDALGKVKDRAGIVKERVYVVRENGKDKAAEIKEKVKKEIIEEFIKNKVEEVVSSRLKEVFKK